MLNVSQILVRASGCRFVLAAGVVGALAGCGLRGPLYLPSGDVAAARATLPQSLAPDPPASAAGTGTGAAKPALIP
jgi:predicted small lipoprotein YifL